MSTTTNNEPSGTESSRTNDATPWTGEEAGVAKRVLLVDDHGMFREVLGVVLKHHVGFGESVQVESLAQARRALGRRSNGRESEFNLAVVDLDLPGGDGLELLEELHEAAPGVPVIAVTASLDHGVRARALEAGASEVLATTATGEEIVATARRLGG